MLSKVVFVCSSTKSTGFGHVSRCLNIALEINKIAPLSRIYFCGDYLAFAEEVIKDSGFLCVNSTSEIGLDHGTVLVVDDYNVKKDSLLNYKSYGCRIVVIDDFEQFLLPCVDINVNFRFQPDTGTPNANRALGLKYFPFKNSFRKVRDERLELLDREHEINTVLLFIGGSDIGSSAPRVLACLDRIFVGKEIIWLSDDSNNTVTMENNALLKTPFVKDMALLYSQADALICGGGLSKYESGFCLLPNAAISQNDGQQQDTSILARHHLSFDLGLADSIDDDLLCDRLSSFFEPENIRLQKLAMRLEYDCDSTNRVSTLIVKK